MLSGGGIASVQEAKDFPIRLIESGPAGRCHGGVVAREARPASITWSSYDMGGTTAKMCLIENGAPDRKFDFEAGRVRRFQQGLGLAAEGLGRRHDRDRRRRRVHRACRRRLRPDEGRPAQRRREARPGLLRPRRHGADRHRCRPGARAASTRRISSAARWRSTSIAVQRAVDANASRRRCTSRRMTPRWASSRIVDETMAAATRMHLAEKGRDPRRYTLIAFGGAGPVHACEPRAAAEDAARGGPARRGRGLGARLPGGAAGDGHGAVAGRAARAHRLGARGGALTPRWRRKPARC